MDRLFDSLGRFVFRFRWWVLAISLLLGTLGAWGAQGLKDVLYGSNIELAGTPSSRVAQTLRDEFHHPFAELAIVTLSSSRSIERDASYRLFVNTLAGKLGSLPEVQSVLTHPETRSLGLAPADGHRAVLLVGLKTHGVQEAERATPRMRAVVERHGLSERRIDPSVRWATTGRGALSYDVNQFGAQVSAKAEEHAIPLTLVVLVLAFGALVAAGIPLGMGILTTLLTMGVLSLLGRVTPLSSMVQNVSTMVGLAVGIDYSLLMVTRFREALARGLDVADAVAETMRTAGQAVSYSGLTVIIGMAGLGLTPSLDTRSIGLGGALVVLMAVLLALSALPAVLSVLGRRVEAPRWLTSRMRRVDPGTAWRRWAALLMRHPGKAALVGTGLLLALASPVLFLKTEVEISRWLPKSLEFHVGFDMLQAMGKKYVSTPIQLVVTSQNGPVLNHLEDLIRLSQRIHADPRVLDVTGPVDLPGVSPTAYRTLYRMSQLTGGIDPRLKGLVISQDGRKALFLVLIKNEEPFERSRELASDLTKWDPLAPDLRLEIGGQASFYNDLDAATVRSFPFMVGFIILATFVVLALAYRSWLVPLKAIVLNLGAIAAGYGTLVIVCQWGIGRSLIGLEAPTQGIPLSVLTLIFGVVFGLSMDYEVFLISRIKERFDQTGDNSRAIEEGLAATGPLITSAALIMVAIFGAFAWADFTVIKMIGVGLGSAVLVDATVIRVLLAPSLMRLAGNWNWHPGVRRSLRSDSPIVTAAR